jgi:hypothetical protein
MTEVSKPNDDTAAQLAEVRAKRAALAEARRVREAQRAIDEALADEKQSLADDQAIEAAEAEHGPVGKKLAVVKTDMGAIILKRPHPAAFKRFQDKGSLKTVDLDRLVRGCLVHPLPDVFDLVMDELPATLLRCADAVSYLAGVRAEDVSAK